MIYSKISRRTVLRGLGISIALPFLDAMRARRADADAQAEPVRFMLFNSPNGFYRPAMTSIGTGSSYQLAESLRPLEQGGLRGDITVLSGLDNVVATPGGDVHSPHAQLLTAGPFTGPRVVPFGAAGPSWDQALDARTSSSSSPTRCLVVSSKRKEVSDSDATVRGQPSLVQHYLSWTDSQHYVRSQRDAARIFESVFGLAANGGDATAARAVFARKQTLIDSVLPQVVALQNQVGSRDRATLDQYLSSLRSVEQRFAQTASTCGGQFVIPEADTVPQRLKLLSDLSVLAFQCQRSRLIVLTTDYETTSAPYSWVPVPKDWQLGGVPVPTERLAKLGSILSETPYHLGLSHHGGDPDRIAAVRLIDEWHVAQFAYVVNQLKQLPDGDGSLLDHAMLLFTASIADGANHQTSDLPCVLAGRGSGAIRPGRHLRLSSGASAMYQPGAGSDEYSGVPFANLLLTLSEAMGSPEPTEQFGNSTGRVALT